MYFICYFYGVRNMNNKVSTETLRCQFHKNIFQRVRDSTLIERSRKHRADNTQLIVRDEFFLTPFEWALFQYFHSNKNLFLSGNLRSVVNRYDELYEIIYDLRYNRTCQEDNGTHLTTGIASYPKTNYQQMVDLSLGRNEDCLLADRCHAKAVCYQNKWYDTVRIRFPREKYDDGDFQMVYTKLLDETFETFDAAWTRFFSIYNWMEDVHKALGGFYPVRRSAWDLIVARKYYKDTNNIADEELVSNLLIPDIGGEAERLLTIRILLRMMYLSCCMSRSLERTVTSAKRITKRGHECWFPIKSSGIYYGLFATMSIPHNLICDNTKTCDPTYIKNWFKNLEKLLTKARERLTLNQNNNSLDLQDDYEIFRDVIDRGLSSCSQTTHS